MQRNLYTKQLAEPPSCHLRYKNYYQSTFWIWRDMENKFYGLTQNDARNVQSHQLMKSNILPHCFSEISKSAGKKWLSKFLKCFGQLLSLRMPTGTPFARTKGFNKESVAKFFKLLMCEYENHMFPPDRVYNVDESGLLVQFSLKYQKRLDEKEKDKLVE